MKRINLVTRISYILVLSVPVCLTGCDSMRSPFGHSDTYYRYDQPDYRKANATVTETERSTTHKTRKDVTEVEPGISTVKTNSPALTSVATPTTSTVTSDTRMVPGAAPVLGQ